MGADKKKAGPVNYTPIERLLLTSAPLAAAVEMVLDATAAGQIHELGLYVKKKKDGPVISLKEEFVYDLVGIRIPLPMAIELKEAFVAAKETPLGHGLNKKVSEMMDDLRRADESSPPNSGMQDTPGAN